LTRNKKELWRYDGEGQRITDGSLPPSLSGNCTYLSGDCTGLSGDCTYLRGNCTYLRGDCTYLRGNCTYLRGNCTGLSGNCTDLSGDLDACGITDKERNVGMDITTLVSEEKADG
jgi:hypothetical protein